MAAPPQIWSLEIEWLPSAVARWEPHLLEAAEHHQVSPELLAIVTLLPGEILAYRDLIVGMWNERSLPESPTYETWRARLGR